jgi:hypothetical protein
VNDVRPYEFMKLRLLVRYLTVFTNSTVVFPIHMYIHVLTNSSISFVSLCDMLFVCGEKG